MRTIFLFALLVGVVLSFELTNFLSIEETLKMISVPQILGRNQKPARGPLTFSWDNCGSDSDPIQLKSLSLGPDPIVLGQNITLSFAVDIAQAVTSAQAEVTLEKSIFGIWTEIPCIDNIGSCSYSDICSLLNPNHTCPLLQEHGIPCHCPFSVGDYALPESSIKTKDPGISWLSDGDYYAKGVLTSGGVRFACYEVYVSLSSESDE